MNNTIEKDDLTGLARTAECLELLLGDVMQDYFDAHDESTAKQRDNIVYDFNRYRHYTSICFDMAHAIKTELHAKGIRCYR